MKKSNQAYLKNYFQRKKKSKNYNKGIYVKLECVLFQIAVGLSGGILRTINISEIYIHISIMNNQ